jgi:hypothetical protein
MAMKKVKKAAKKNVKLGAKQVKAEKSSSMASLKSFLKI